MTRRIQRLKRVSPAERFNTFGTNIVALPLGARTSKWSGGLACSAGPSHQSANHPDHTFMNRTDRNAVSRRAFPAQKSHERRTLTNLDRKYSPRG